MFIMNSVGMVAGLVRNRFHITAMPDSGDRSISRDLEVVLVQFDCC